MTGRITASELRQMGVLLPEDIPDCASVPRSAVRFGELHADLIGNVVNFKSTLHIDAPWEWLQIDFIVN